MPAVRMRRDEILMRHCAFPRATANTLCGYPRGDLVSHLDFGTFERVSAQRVTSRLRSRAEKGRRGLTLDLDGGAWEAGISTGGALEAPEADEPDEERARNWAVTEGKSTCGCPRCPRGTHSAAPRHGAARLRAGWQPHRRAA